MEKLETLKDWMKSNEENAKACLILAKLQEEQKLKETDFILVSFYENLKMVVHFGKLEKPTKNEPHQVGVWKIKIKK